MIVNNQSSQSGSHSGGSQRSSKFNNNPYHLNFIHPSNKNNGHNNGYKNMNKHQNHEYYRNNGNNNHNKSSNKSINIDKSIKNK